MTKNTNDVETWLDEIDPADMQWRDAQHFRDIRAARKAADAGEAELVRAVAQARAAGEPWSVIGSALGVTKQAAQSRFGKRIEAFRQSA